MLSEADPPPGLGVALWRNYFTRAPHGMVLLRAVRDPSGALEDLEWREVNPAAAATLQLEAGGVVGRRAREVRLPAVGRGFYRRLVRCLRGGSVEAFEQAYPPPRALVVGAGGSERRRARPAAWYAVTIFPLADDHLLVEFRDVTHYKDVLREAVDQLNRDDLTGLANRRHLKTRFWVLRRREVPMALLYFDLNGFKAVNDTYGHEVGDRVLAIIGRRLLDNVRPAEVVARLGGDEFAVLLAEAEPSAVTRVTQRLLAAVEEPIALPEGVVRLSASVGAATSPGDAEAFEALLSQADQRMYEQKRSLPTTR